MFNDDQIEKGHTPPTDNSSIHAREVFNLEDLQKCLHHKRNARIIVGKPFC